MLGMENEDVQSDLVELDKESGDGWLPLSAVLVRIK